MPNFTVYTNDGTVVRSGYVAGNDSAATMQAGQGESVLIGAIGHRDVHRVNLSNPAKPVLELIPSPQKTLADIKRETKAAVASRRWQAETGGMPFGGGTIATDDRSKLLLASAAEQARLNPAFTVDWKLEDGSWAHLDAAGVGGAYAGIFAWVNACFAREKALCALIDAAANEAAITALSPTIQAFWP